MGQPFVKYVTDYLKEKLYHKLSSRGKKTLRTFDKNLEDEKTKDLQQAQEREREERKKKKNHREWERKPKACVLGPEMRKQKFLHSP